MIFLLNTIFLIIFKKGWENDDKYTLLDFLLHDSNPVILDSFTFFFIGRLYKRSGIDCLIFIMPVLISCLYASSITNIWFLQRSLSSNIVNPWPWQLIVYSLIFGSVILVILAKHIVHSIRDNTYFYRICEVCGSLFFFVTPYAFWNNRHFHHWFMFWLFGMHCNRNEWVS